MTKGTSPFDEQSKGRPGKPFFLNLIVLPLLILLVLLVILLVAPRSSRAEAAAGRIAVIESGAKAQVVNIVRLGKKGFEKAKTGDQVFVGDTIKTGAEIRVKLDMADASVVSIGPQSTLRIKAHRVKQDEGKRSSVFKVLKGIARFIIAKTVNNKDWTDSTVIVETPVAVAGVRGTDFIASVSSGRGGPEVEVAVLEGIVTVRNNNLQVKGSVTVNGDEFTTVPRNAAPAQPWSLSAEHRSRLVNATSVTASGNFSQQSQGKATGKQTEVDIETALKDGVPLNTIIDQAVESRMSIDKVITAILEAGVPAYTVVYTAIEEGYSATAVVDAALTTGAPLNEVVAGAVNAGAETKAIIGGAQMVGVSPEAVAAAIAKAQAEGAPVYGMPQPTSDEPLTEQILPKLSFPTTPGGGATPSPQPASPM